MNSWKNRFSLALSAAILLSAPGLPSYEAAAQVLSSPVGARQAPAWLPVVSAITAKLQESPSPENADALRTLGQARLELTLNPQAASALLFASELPAQASSAEALAKLSAQDQVQLLVQASRRASEKLSGEAQALLEKAKSPDFSSADRKRLQQLAASWFCLRQERGGEAGVQGVLAPYAGSALDAASARLNERGVAGLGLDQYLLANHRAAF